MTQSLNVSARSPLNILMGVGPPGSQGWMSCSCCVAVLPSTTVLLLIVLNPSTTFYHFATFYHNATFYHIATSYNSAISYQCTTSYHTATSYQTSTLSKFLLQCYLPPPPVIVQHRHGMHRGRTVATTTLTNLPPDPGVKSPGDGDSVYVTTQLQDP